MTIKCLNWLIDLFYPRFCYHCGRMGEFLCERCYSQLEFTLATDLREDLQRALGEEQPIYLARLQATVSYNELVAKMMHQYKYLGVKDLSQTFAHWLYQFTDLPTVDAITYIPIHARRLDERGYNQAKLLAEELAKKMQVPCWPLLKREVYREKQAQSKNKQERLQKTKQIFALQKVVNEKIKAKKSVLLVDDVVTTGATMNEAARILKSGGWQNIYGLAVAHGS